MLTLLLANWRLMAAGAVVAAVALMGWRVSAWHEGYKELGQVKRQLQAEQACSAGTKCQERQQILEKRASDEEEKIRKEFKRQLAIIASRPVPSTPVRLCRPRSQSNVRVPSASTGTGSAGGAEFPVEVGRDIRVELYRLADEADKEALKLRMLWKRDQALATTEKNDDAR